jgi:hypothetical protein
MNFLRVDTETPYKDVRDFVGADSFSHVTFHMMNDRGSFETFSRHAVKADGSIANIYTNRSFGDVLLGEGVGMAGCCGGIGGTSGVGNDKVTPPDGVLTDSESYVREIIETPSDRMTDLWGVYVKARKCALDGAQSYIVKSLLPTRLPKELLEHAVNETAKAMRKWARKASNA